MTKVFIGVSAALSLFILFGFYRYSAVVEENGRLDQANRQFEQTIMDQNHQLEKQQSNRLSEETINKNHFENAMAIKDDELKSQLAFKQHELDRLNQKLQALKNENIRLKKVGNNKTVSKSETLSINVDQAKKEDNNGSMSEKCIEMPVPEFYLKQL